MELRKLFCRNIASEYCHLQSRRSNNQHVLNVFSRLSIFWFFLGPDKILSRLSTGGQYFFIMTTLKVPEQKIILCGEYGVGKSSIFRRFTSNSYTTLTDRQSTLGLDHYSKRYHVAGKDIKLQLWDTGGMERVASITSSYYKFADAAILVFSLDSPESFNMVSQHLLDIVSYAENAKIYLCGNKSDLKSLIQITDSDMEAFCEQCHTLVAGTFKLSCKTGEGVDEMFSCIAFQLAVSNRSKFERDQLTHNNGLQLNNFQHGESENFNSNRCFC